MFTLVWEMQDVCCWIFRIQLQQIGGKKRKAIKVIAQYFCLKKKIEDRHLLRQLNLGLKMRRG